MEQPKRSHFVKVWQGQEGMEGVGWARTIRQLKGNSIKVLSLLLYALRFGNKIPGPSEASKDWGITRQIVSRAYVELGKWGFILSKDRQYYLNPLYCWKGTDKGFQAALSLLDLRYSGSRKRKPNPEKRKAVTEFKRMLKEQQVGYYVDRGNHG